MQEMFNSPFKFALIYFLYVSHNFNKTKTSVEYLLYQPFSKVYTLLQATILHDSEITVTMIS